MTSAIAELNATDAREWMRCARRGDFEAAWQAGDRIRHRDGNARDWTMPRHLQRVWDGSAFGGRRVLIRCYHGLGDTLQFIRYAPLVRAVAPEVIVWAQPELLPLLQTVAGIDRLLPLHDGAPDADYDVDIELMELPYAFRTTLDTIPAGVPYLSVKPVTLNGHRPHIGIVWRAGEWNQTRSLAFRDLRRLLDIDQVSWHALQIGRRPDEHHERLHIPRNEHVTDLARLMCALDLVITVDSMPAHLAGALGIPVWTILPPDADWRWMEQRVDSPWYPTMRLFRRRQDGWGEVIDQMHQAVAAISARD
jgi:hypothetical protein